MYDLIGDIHGHCATLVKLLEQLGYTKQSGVWQHPQRKIIFLGDYIDRGPQIRETLQLVKAMVDEGHAIALMGNHEYNAVSYATPDGKGSYLRSHNATHTKQHSATLHQFANFPEEWERYLDWFRKLPLFLDLGDLRAVHACWDEAHIEWLKENAPHHLTHELLLQAHEKNTHAHKVIEETLKGKEINIPAEFVWYDKDGHARTSNRVKWWKEPTGASFGDFLFSCPPALMNEPVSTEFRMNVYPRDAPPVFIGHYWLEDAEPMLQASNVICLDYSVAKDGFLLAYRWNGEQKADIKNFVIQR